MRMKPMMILYKKEIMDLLRDKKTIIAMILIPLLLYPSMMLLSLLMMQGMAKQSAEKEYRIAMVESEVKYDVEDVLFEGANEKKYNFTFISYKTEEEAKHALSSKDVELVIVSEPVVFHESTASLFADSKLFSLKIYDLSANTNSTNAYQNVNDVLNSYSESLRQKALENAYENAEEIIHPIAYEVESISTSEENAGSLIGMILPFLLIISILTGAIYPAIDATAGERERGTLETIMTLPVRKSEIMVSKFLSVSTIAIFSALLNLLSMFGMIFYLYKTIDLSGLGMAGFEFSQFVPAMISLGICLPVFSMFTAAVSLCICIFAKSFKEANNITSPILIVFMFAAMASILPTVELTNTTALIPVTNIALLIKSVFSLDYNPGLVAIVLFSNLAYCLIMVVIMSTLFSSEDVMFGEGKNGVHIFERRANMKKGQIPGYGDIILLFAVMLLFMIFASSVLVLKFGLWGTAIIQLLILLMPVLYAFYLRSDLKELFSLKLPKFREFVGSIVIWIGGLLLNQVLLSLLMRLFPQMNETSQSLFDTISGVGFPTALIVVGICPAIAEEAAFRGMLFGTLQKRTKLIIAILVSAVLFGLYHMNFLQFFAGLFMGIIMAYMVYKSKSIVTSVVFHMLNNSFSVVGTYYPNIIESIPFVGSAEPGIKEYMIMLFAGVIILVLGLFLFGAFSGRKNLAKTEEV
ncbi:MAG: CPBP family intramembrane metalloprotease [Lachnospiraceae bacterium]|nr:CPBP family intramembrane metalloprotease [Lachnospiraceae bacterium]